MILTLTSKIKATTSKIFQNVGFILANAILYYYFTRIFGPFQLYSLTFFTLDQVKPLIGVAFVSALAIFYGPARGLISILLGEFLVQWKLSTTPTWWFICLFSLFLIPLLFYKVKFNSGSFAKFSIKVGVLASFSAFFSVAGFFLLALLFGIPLVEILPQWGTFTISSTILFIPLVIVMAVSLAHLRQPREIYSQVLTHHPWDDRDHTISIRFGDFRVFFCTRCSGMVLGVIGILIVSDIFSFIIAPEIAILLCIILPAPGLFIWSGQKFGFWKDKTWSRILNGILLGVSIFMLTMTRPLILEMTLILAIYFVIFYAVMFGGTYYQRKKLLAEVEETLRKYPKEEKEELKDTNETRPNPQ